MSFEARARTSAPEPRRRRRKRRRDEEEEEEAEEEDARRGSTPSSGRHGSSTRRAERVRDRKLTRREQWKLEAQVCLRRTERGQSKDGAGGEKALSSPSFAEARERGERSGGLRSRGERARGGL